MLQQAIKHLHLSAIIVKLFTRYFPHMKCFIIKLKMEQQPSLSNASVKGKLFDLLSPQKLFHSQEKNFIQGEVLRLTGNSYTTIYLQGTLTFSDKRMERIYASQINVSWTLVIVILEGGSQVSKRPDQISYNIFFVIISSFVKFLQDPRKHKTIQFMLLINHYVKMSFKYNYSSH